LSASDDIGRERQAFYDRIDGDNLAPLWEVFHELVVREKLGLWREARGNR
jgi:gentisate 1,2-dioxygenase